MTEQSRLKLPHGGGSVRCELQLPDFVHVAHVALGAVVAVLILVEHTFLVGSFALGINIADPRGETVFLNLRAQVLRRLALALGQVQTVLVLVSS